MEGLDRRAIAEKLSEWLDHSGETQGKVSERAGLSRTTVSNLLNERIASPHRNTVRKLARCFGATVEGFLAGPEFSPKAPMAARPEVQDWVRGLGPEATLLAMNDDEFYGHAESVIRDPFDVRDLVTILEQGRDAVEAALKGPTQDMPEALRPNEPAGGPEDRVYAAIRRRQPRRRVAQWARARAHVRARNLFEHALRLIAAMPEEAQLEPIVEETVEKQT